MVPAIDLILADITRTSHLPNTPCQRKRLHQRFVFLERWCRLIISEVLWNLKVSVDIFTCASFECIELVHNMVYRRLKLRHVVYFANAQFINTLQYRLVKGFLFMLLCLQHTDHLVQVVYSAVNEVVLRIELKRHSGNHLAYFFRQCFISESFRLWFNKTKEPVHFFLKHLLKRMESAKRHKV